MGYSTFPFTHFEKKPSTFTCWVLPDKKDLTQFRTSQRIHKCYNLQNNLWWATESKVFEKSVYIMSKGSPSIILTSLLNITTVELNSFFLVRIHVDSLKSPCFGSGVKESFPYYWLHHFCYHRCKANWSIISWITSITFLIYRCYNCFTPASMSSFLQGFIEENR